MIPFNQPYLTGNEPHYLERVYANGQLSGNGELTAECHSIFRNDFGFNNVLLTNSATAALEMTSILIDFEAEDELILPSYTFVASATPFAMRNVNLKFCDSQSDHPNIDPNQIETLISEKTKAILVVHYAGMACEMERIMEIAQKHDLIVIEDASHSFGAYYKDQPLGSIGDFGIISFHETKNISCGQGGLLIVNNSDYWKRANIIWEKGTNRKEFREGKVDHYSWVDHGSNFYPSEITSAFLRAQLDVVEMISSKRKQIWNSYFEAFSFVEKFDFKLPVFNENQTNNHHIFYLVAPDKETRNDFLKFMQKNGVLALFHYEPLHRSTFVKDKLEIEITLSNAEVFGDSLIRLPIFADLKENDLQKIIQLVHSYFKQ